MTERDNKIFRVKFTGGNLQEQPTTRGHFGMIFSIGDGSQNVKVVAKCFNSAAILALEHLKKIDNGVVAGEHRGVYAAEPIKITGVDLVEDLIWIP